MKAEEAYFDMSAKKVGCRDVEGPPMQKSLRLLQDEKRVGARAGEGTKTRGVPPQCVHTNATPSILTPSLPHK